GFLWAGTDDGNVWLTRNDGATWEAIPTTRFAGLPAGDIYVARIEPSHYDSLTAYVAFDNHRWNDFTPYLYITTDGGKSFRSIVNNLSTASGGAIDVIRAFREDPVNRDLLYVGTSTGAYVTLDRGASWQKFMTGLPTVPVYDLKIHPRDRELIAATHGRGFWVVDVAPLQQLNRTIAARPVYLFEPKRAFEYGQGPAMGESSNGAGHRNFMAPSPPHGAEIVYRLASAVRDTVRIIITDAKGDTMRTLTGPNRAGLHKVVWDLRGRAPRQALSPSQVRDSIMLAHRLDFVLDSLTKAGTINAQQAERFRGLATGGGGGGGGFGGRQAPIAQTGDYLVTLKVGNEVQRQVLRVEHVRDSSSPFVSN